MMLKKGQEEMVGFAIIMVIIAVIIIILLSFMLNFSEDETVENYEIENFLQAMLQYTTNCESRADYLSIQGLITYCREGKSCFNEEDPCKMLNETLMDIMDNSWAVNENSAVKGYHFKVAVGEEEMFTLRKGNITTNYKGAFQDFAKGANDYEVFMNVYYD